MTSPETEATAPDSERIVGCSVTGPSHERDDVPCQDAWAAHDVSENGVVVAVGDGRGSADLSHRGSRRATREVADRLRQYLQAGGAVGEASLERVMEKTFSGARDALREEAIEEREPLASFGTTLLALVASPDGAAAAAVGDGGIVGQRDGEQFPLVAAEESEYANTTRPITNTNWEKGYRFEFHDPIDAAAVFSDGVSPFAWTTDEGRSLQEAFFDQVFEFIRGVSDPADAKRELCAFLNDDHFRRYSTDDKTLVLARVVTPDTDSVDVAETRGRVSRSWSRAERIQDRFQWPGRGR